MMYYEDMQSKYGFSDGNAIPQAIELYRTVYIRVMNKLLEKHGSKLRVAAFDRAGLHNWCMLFTVPVDEYNTIPDPTEYVDHQFSSAEHPPDNEYMDALSEAHEMCLDDLVVIDAKVDDAGLEETINSI